MALDLLPKGLSYALLGTPDEKIIEVCSGGRVFVDGQETCDVERIGAAVVRWAKAYFPAADLQSVGTDDD